MGISARSLATGAGLILIEIQDSIILSLFSH